MNSGINRNPQSTHPTYSSSVDDPYCSPLLALHTASIPYSLPQFTSVFFTPIHRYWYSSSRNGRTMVSPFTQFLNIRSLFRLDHPPPISLWPSETSGQMSNQFLKMTDRMHWYRLCMHKNVRIIADNAQGRPRCNGLFPCHLVNRRAVGASARID